MAEQYQSFLNKKGASDSFEKLRRLGLPNLHGKSFLDVGCNEGFFCGVAYYAGAKKVVGLDLNSEFIERAKSRFPSVDFRCSSWDADLSEFGSFDVILLASAIHYAADQPALIKKLLGLLAPRGILVLELGIAPGEGDAYVEVKRSAGDSRQYATMRALDKALDGFVFRVIGQSVPQSGDPVPRWVVHVTHRRPTIMFFDSPSFTGKSSTVRTLSKFCGVKPDGFRVAGIDRVLQDIEFSMSEKYPSHRKIIDKISTFKKEKSIFANVILEMIGHEDHIDDFVSFIIDYRIDGALMTLWDGYIPEKYRYQFRENFSRRGFIVWGADPFDNLGHQRLNPVELMVNLPIGAAFQSSQDLRVYLDSATIESGSLTLVGWAADAGTKSPLEQFLVFFGETLVEDAEIRRCSRPGANREIGCPPEVLLGFQILISADRLRSLLTTEILFLGLAGKNDLLKQLLGLRLFVQDRNGGVLEARYSSKLQIVTG